MRAVQNPQVALGQIPIEDIPLDPSSRDDIPAILKGIQFVYCDQGLGSQFLGCLEKHLLLGDKSSPDSAAVEPDQPRALDLSQGGPGMDLWEIVVLELLKQELNCDYDSLSELANKHLDVRRMLGLSDALDGAPFHWRTVNRNVQLLRPQVLDEINQLVVQADHALVGHTLGQEPAVRCDSFVVETNIGDESYGEFNAVIEGTKI